MTLLLTLACTGLGGVLDADQQLLISAVSGTEEAFAKDGFAEPDAVGETEERAPLFRECDPAGLYDGLKAEADRDGDGQLSDREEKECTRDGGPHAKDRQIRMHMLGLIYDVDQDTQLSDTEKETLFSDFEMRCEALHEQILVEFDADGDGALSDDEKEAARAAIEAQREERRAEMEARRAEMDGARPETAEGPPSAPEGLPPFAWSYDTDGDDQLSDEELEVLRAEARARIQNGEPPFDPPEDVVAE